MRREAKQGWQLFTKRRTAAAKLNSLPDATPDELEAHNDVCAICYQTMSSAKVTRCKHFFHWICLRKWLYLQDTCPLCHSTLHNQPSENSDNPGGNGPDPRDDNEVIDNDDVDGEISDDELDRDSDIDGAEGRGHDWPSLSSSESEMAPSDNDLIYDSMEDFGESSSQDEALPNEQ